MNTSPNPNYQGQPILVKEEADVEMDLANLMQEAVNSIKQEEAQKETNIQLETAEIKKETGFIQKKILFIEKIKNSLSQLNKNHLIDIVLRLLGVENKRYQDNNLKQVAAKYLASLERGTLLMMAFYLIRIIFRAYGWKAFLLMSFLGNYGLKKAQKHLSGTETKTEAGKERERARQFLNQKENDE